jgi:fumarate hydratase subunit alpha
MSIREISAAVITESVERLVLEANFKLPEDVLEALRRASSNEESPVGTQILQNIIDNACLAKEESLPICQDTGMAVVFCEIGQDVHITGGAFEEAVNEGVRRGYVDGLMRLSIVADPLRRKNTDTNTPAVIHTRIVPGDKIKIILCPKGFGSENMSALKMFNPTASPDEIESFIINTVVNAGPNPCPPVVVGVGLGGSLDSAAVEAKKALTRSLSEANPDPFYGDMEKRVLSSINDSGIGPMGMGGRTTALAVHITPLATHIAGLPCVISMGCHAARHAECTL